MTEIDAVTARAVLHAFWWSKGETTAEVYAQALLAAYELGDQKEFADVLCEVASPHEGVGITWEVFRLVLERLEVQPR